MTVDGLQCKVYDKIRMKKLLFSGFVLVTGMLLGASTVNAANAEDFQGRPVMSNQVLVRYSDDAERLILRGQIEEENKSSSIWEWFRNFLTSVFSLGFNTYEKEVKEQYATLEQDLGIIGHVPLEKNPTLRAPSRSLQLGSFNPYGDDPLRNLYIVVFTRGTVQHAVDRFVQESFVQAAQPNFIYQTTMTPNDPDFPQQWSHTRVGSTQAWEKTTGSRDVVIAILDTGVNYNHPDLVDNMWTHQDYPNHGYDFYGTYCELLLDPSCTDLPQDNDPMDEAGHGTMVAGVAAAVCNNNRDVCGPAWQTGIMAIRVGDATTISTPTVLKGLQFAAEQKADIVNMSFGFYYKDCNADPPIDAELDQALSRMVNFWDILLITSVGNEAGNARCDILSNHPDLLAVTATTLNQNVDIAAEYSNYAPTEWKNKKVIAAPGGGGTHLIITTSKDGGLVMNAGTSFAAPFVAGVAALVKAQQPNLSAQQLRQHLIDTAVDIVDVNSNPPAGMTYGKLVNAAAALGAAAVTPEPTVVQIPGSLSCVSDFGGVCKTNSECAQFALTPIGIHGCDPVGTNNTVCCVESSTCAQQRGYCINPASKDKFPDCTIDSAIACAPASNVCCIPANLVTPKPVSCANDKQGQCLDLQQCAADAGKTGTEVYDCNAQANEVCCVPKNLVTPTVPAGGQPPTPTPQPTQPAQPTQPPQQNNETSQVDWTYNGAGKCWAAWAGNVCSYASHEGGETSTGRDLDGTGGADIECSQGTGAGQSTTVKNISSKSFDLRCEYYVCNQCVESSPGSKTARCDQGIHASAAKSIVGTVQLTPGKSATCTANGIQ